jgi:hypothetical protein
MSKSISDHRKLLEGMWAGDLNDLISAVVSIDEFKSKIDSNAIVIGFFIRDVDAAGDLNRFIQKSTVDILYSEVSPAPDQKGFYIVFVEMLRNDKIVKNICDLVEEVTLLTNIESWKASVYGVEKNIDLSPEELEKAMKLSHKVSDTNRDEKIVTITKKVDKLSKRLSTALRRLKRTALENVSIYNGSILIEDRCCRGLFDVGHIGSPSELDNGGLSLSFKSLSECRNLAVGFGENWDIFKINESYVAHDLIDDVVIELIPQT